MAKNTDHHIHLARPAVHEGTSYGPGTVPVSKRVADALVAEGRAVHAEAPKAEKTEPAKAPATGTGDQAKTLADFTDDQIQADAERRFGKPTLDDHDDDALKAEYVARFGELGAQATGDEELEKGALYAGGVYAFLGWLTTREEASGPFSGSENAAQAAELAGKFVNAQGWSAEVQIPEWKNPDEAADGGADDQGADVESDIPDDFPGRAKLIAAGLDSLEKVRAHDFDATPVTGLGDVFTERIRARLAG